MTTEEGEHYLAPEFYLLGPAKAATTSFWQMAGHAGGMIYPGNLNGGDERLARWPHPKELSIFNCNRSNFGRSWWLRHFPRCDRSQRMVTLDATPTYINSESAPQQMKLFYEEQSSEIKFGVVLRDPLHRAHTAFHWMVWMQVLQGDDQCAGPRCPACLSPDFQAYVHGVINNGSDPCRLFAQGNYAPQLHKWFDAFSPSQFSIFLFNDLVKHGTGVAELWQKLGLKITEESVTIPHINKNERKKKTLEEELNPSTLISIQAHIEKTMGINQLVLELVNKVPKPTLAGYNASGNFSPQSVKQWLQNGW